MFLSEPILFLTKLLPIVLYPVGLAIGLLLLGVVCMLRDRRRLSLACIGAALVLLWVCSMPVFAEWSLGSLERQYPATAIADTPKADVAILLGGAIGQPLPPRVTPDLSPAADRVLHAARLYRAGKVGRILVAAGNIPWVSSVKSEAELIRDLLEEWGVPEAAIQIAGTSRNTYENALEVKALRQRSDFSSALLVTSAAHMPRALATFRHAGLPVIPATTDVEVTHSDTTILAWLPGADALAMTTAAMREWIGFLAYRARGYL